jgi:hypothetical protein
MKFIKVGNNIINLAMVAWADRNALGTVTLHFAVPRATTVAGTTYSGNQPIASDHYSMQFSGAEGDEVWKQLENAGV